MSRPLVVVIGPCGCGKSTLGAALATALGVPFLDADSLHTPGSIAKMTAGTPLDDSDRWSWLLEVGAALQNAVARGHGLVTACSALKQVYRATILAAAPTAVFLLLDADHDLLHARLARRPGHFMPPTLINSQLATLEPLTAAEPGLQMDGTQPVADLVTAAVAWIERGLPPAAHRSA
jgi:gluconokinase